MLNVLCLYSMLLIPLHAGAIIKSFIVSCTSKGTAELKYKQIKKILVPTKRNQFDMQAMGILKQHLILLDILYAYIHELYYFILSRPISGERKKTTSFRIRLEKKLTGQIRIYVKRAFQRCLLFTSDEI